MSDTINKRLPMSLRDPEKVLERGQQLLRDEEKQAEFRVLLKGIIKRCGINQTETAEHLGCSPQHVSDLLSGRRLPSVGITNALCSWQSTGEVSTRNIHLAAARAHGWQV